MNGQMLAAGVAAARAEGRMIYMGMIYNPQPRRALAVAAGARPSGDLDLIRRAQWLDIAENPPLSGMRRGQRMSVS